MIEISLAKISFLFLMSIQSYAKEPSDTNLPLYLKGISVPSVWHYFGGNFRPYMECTIWCMGRNA